MPYLIPTLQEPRACFKVIYTIQLVKFNRNSQVRSGPKAAQSNETTASSGRDVKFSFNLPSNRASSQRECPLFQSDPLGCSPARVCSIPALPLKSPLLSSYSTPSPSFTLHPRFPLTTVQYTSWARIHFAQTQTPNPNRPDKASSLISRYLEQGLDWIALSDWQTQTEGSRPNLQDISHARLALLYLHGTALKWIELQHQYAQRADLSR